MPQNSDSITDKKITDKKDTSPENIVLQWLPNEILIEILSKFESEDLILLKLVSPQFNDLIKENPRRLFKLDWLVNFISQYRQIDAKNAYDLFHLLYKEGVTGELRTLSKTPPLSLEEAEKAVNSAVVKGQLHFAEYLLGLIGKKYALSLNHLEISLRSAVQAGHLPFAKYLLGRISEKYPLYVARSVERSALKNAIRNDQWEVASYLMNLIGVNKLIPDRLSEIFVRAINKRQWEIAKRIVSLTTSNRPNQSIFVEELERIAIHGQLTLLKLIWRINPLDPKLNLYIDCILGKAERFPSPVIEWLKNTRTPFSYASLSEKHPEPMMKARALLDDYTKGGSSIRLLFYGHPKRHHVADVAKLVQRIDAGEVNEENLISELEKIASEEGFKKTGSLARRIQFIQMEIFANEVRSPGLALS